MINIFNLFLVLSACWAILIFANNMLFLPYILIGIMVCALITFVSWKMGIVSKKSRFLFLNFGFFKHFISVIARSFFRSIILTIKSALFLNNTDPIIYHFPIEKQNDGNLTLLIATLSFIPGVFCVGIKDDELIIHALNEDCLINARLDKIYKGIEEINDNRLV